MRVEFDSVYLAGEVNDLKVGDEVEIVARARVTGLREEHVDVTGWGDELPTVIAGEHVVRVMFVRHFALNESRE